MEFSEEITAYISQFPEQTQILLNELRGIIREALPDAMEVMSYNMPAFKQGKILVYFAGYKNHIGFYPTAQPIVHFEERLKEFKTSKGAIQFPLDKLLPEVLIKDIVAYRLSCI